MGVGMEGERSGLTWKKTLGQKRACLSVKGVEEAKHPDCEVGAWVVQSGPGGGRSWD